MNKQEYEPVIITGADIASGGGGGGFMPKAEPYFTNKNSWHERGELPPVGVECESRLIDDNWIGGFVSARSKHYEIWQYLNGDEYVGANGDREFRPIKSEREKFVDAALAAADKSKPECDVTFAQALYDAGFRAPE